MQKILSINETKVYSRKQIIAWISSYGFSYEQLRNGLFYVKILRKLIPHDINRCKIYEKPGNQYEQTQNMNIVKRVLNKHNLQLNMNVQAIIAAKNGFQLANWFKNLYDQNRSDNDTQFHLSQKSQTPSKIMQQIPVSIANYKTKTLSRATSSDKSNANSGIKKLGRVTSGFIGIPKPDKLSYTLKMPRQSLDSQLTYKIFSTSNETQQKDMKGRMLRMAQARMSRSKSRNSKGNNWFNSPSNSKRPQALTQQQKIANLMKIQSIQEQISVYQSTLKRISEYVNRKQEFNDMETMRREIISIIYKISNLQANAKEQI